VCYSLLDLLSHDDPSDVSLILSAESVPFELSIPIPWNQDDTCLCLIVFDCSTAFVCSIASLLTINTHTDDDRELTVDVTDKLCSS